MKKPAIAHNQSKRAFAHAEYPIRSSYTEGDAERHSLKALAADWLPKEAPRDATELFAVALAYVKSHPLAWTDEVQLRGVIRLTNAVGQINPENCVTNRSALALHLWRAAEMVLGANSPSIEPELITTAQVLACTACALDARLFTEAWCLGYREEEVRP